jgi:uncharacterized membrane protein
MTKGRFAVCVAAVIAGTSIQPIREYRAAGTITTVTIVIAAITLCIGLALVLAVGWWANRPERGGSNE